MTKPCIRAGLLGCMILWASLPALAGDQFTVAQVGPLGNAPFSIIASDLNDDSHLDLAVTNYSSASLSLLYGIGNGTFAGRTDYAVGVTPGGVAAGDFNRDGRMDVATTAEYAYDISVLYGQTSGGLGARQDFPADYFCRHLVTADLDDDGWLDLAAACINSSAVSIYYGQAGGFAPRQNIPTAFNPIGITVVDLNKDGRLDIATTNRGSHGHEHVSILYGQSAGGFAPHVDYDSMDGGDPDPRDIVSGDWNQDGRLDLVVANYWEGNLGILYGMPDGSFGDRLVLPVGSRPYGLAAADFDLNGWLDLAVTISGGNKVSLLRGLNDGSFGIPEDYVVGSSPIGLTAGDFNQDGAMDLAVAHSDGVAILINTIPEPAALALLVLGALAVIGRRRQQDGA